MMMLLSVVVLLMLANRPEIQTCCPCTKVDFLTYMASLAEGLCLVFNRTLQHTKQHFLGVKEILDENSHFFTPWYGNVFCLVSHRVISSLQLQEGQHSVKQTGLVHWDTKKKSYKNRVAFCTITAATQVAFLTQQ